MAEKIVSPGVFARENDISFLTPAAAEVSTAVVGPTVKGPVNIPTVVRSYSEYVAVYGDSFKSGSDFYQHSTSIAAEKYFEQGGTSLLVTRVAPGSFTSATSAIGSGSDSYTTTVLTLGTLSEGTIMNNSGSMVSGSLLEGSADNIRWEITDSNENLGTFSLIVRRGDDNHKSKIILETWNDLSLDPKSDRYVAKVIGDVSYSAAGGILTEVGDNPNRSAYIRVSAVNGKTPDYFNNAGVKQYTGKLPLVGSGSIGGAFKSATGDLWEAGQQALYFDAIGTNLTTRNTEGLDATGKNALDFNEAIALLANTEEFNFDVLLTPGLNHADHTITVDKFIDLVQKRGDAIYVTDLTGHGDALSTVTAEAQGLNSSFAAAYWPWVKVQAQGVGKQVWVGASAVMGGVYAFNDSVSDQWFAPAGLVRGGIPGVVRTERKLSRADRDTLYVSKVNPLATFPGQGVVAYGQKTLQTKASALDRVNVRRLLINLKRFIGGQADNLVFEQNSIATRNRFLSAVNPYLDLVVQREGLYAYRVVMDDTNNTADVIDRNQLVGQIYIQPTKTAEFIVLDFVVQPTGASFGA